MLTIRMLPVLLVLLASTVCAQQRQPAAEVTLAAMLHAVPVPVDPRRVVGTSPLFTCSRLDLLTGAAGPAAKPGATRALALLTGPHPAWNVGAPNTSGFVSTNHWPATVGSDLDAVDAVMFAPAGDSLAGSVQAMRVLAGAPRLYDAVRIGEALKQRGFAEVGLGGATVFSFREDYSLNMRQRSPGDPFGDGLGLAQRIAITSAGLVMTHQSEAMRRAIDALAGRAPSFADINAMRAVLAGLAESHDAQVVEAIALPLVAGAGKPAPVAALGGPPMPVWVAALLAELAAPPDRPRQRVVLALLDPDDSDAVPMAARAALEARLAAKGRVPGRGVGAVGK